MSIKKLIKNTYLILPVFILVKAGVVILGEERFTQIMYRMKMNSKLNLKEPVSLNEKIQWLKLYYYMPFYRKCCDKYLIHDYLYKKIGKDLAAPLLYVCNKAEEFSIDKISFFPCIVKISSGSGQNLIIRSKDQYSNKYIHSWIRKQIIGANLHTLWTIEHQYISDKPYIVVEKLLQDEKGGVPNDYKLLFTNGELQFIYCSVDRLGINVRQVYDALWKRLPFIWVKGANYKIFEKFSESSNIAPPKSLNEMINIGKRIAVDFPMVRVDFYDTPNGVYIGEITLHHGSGYDKFYPEKFDLLYGKKLILPSRNR